MASFWNFPINITLIDFCMTKYFKCNQSFSNIDIFLQKILKFRPLENWFSFIWKNLQICGKRLIYIQSTPSKTNFNSIQSRWIGIPTIPIIPTLMSYKITSALGASGMFQGQLSNIGKGHYCGWTDSRPCGTFSCLCSLLTLSLWH